MHSSLFQNPGAWICVLSNLVLVMVALNAILLWKLSRRGNPVTVPAKAEAPAASPVRQTTSTAVDPVHFAIITAVVSTLIREPHLILSTRSLDTSGDWNKSISNPWAMEGRAAIFSSHKVR